MWWTSTTTVALWVIINALVFTAAIGLTLAGCSGKKGNKDKNVGKGAAKKAGNNATKTPAKKALLGKKFVGGKVFGKPGGPAAPQNAGKVADTFDPAYQTLNNVEDKFGPAKNDGGGGGGGGAAAVEPDFNGAKPGGPAAPVDAGKKADTFDPNYQTLANVNDAFGAPKGGGGEPGGAAAAGGAGGAGGPGGPAAPSDAAKKADTFDPNYQTLANVDNNAFGGKGGGKEHGGPAAPTDAAKKAETFDPNYQTLANVDNKVF